MKLSYGIFYTNNLAAISKYYREIIDLDYAFGDDKFVAFKIGDALLGIKIKEIEREIPGHQTIIISVEKVDEWYKKLKERDVVIFSEIADMPWGRNFSILDPDGNRVEFFESNIK